MTVMRYRLRSATATQHAGVDARFAPMIAAGEAGYFKFLLASAAAIIPLERELERAGVQHILPDWGDRTRAAAVQSDLSAFDAVELPTPRAPRLRGEACLYGVLYVLEGSRLGASVLLRQVLASGNPRMIDATRYLRHGEHKPMWRSFLRLLESSAAVRSSPEEAIAGARTAFTMFVDDPPQASPDSNLQRARRVRPAAPHVPEPADVE